MPQSKPQRVALVHYWLVGMRGGEKVLEALCELYPDADIYTHVYDPKKLSERLLKHRIFTTFIAKLPNAKNWYQKYLPLMPLALEQLDLSAYDLIISSESGPAKGVITRPDAVHICYCHTPMRYLWDMYPSYLRSSGRVTRWLMRPFAHYLRFWDFASAARVDYFIANSSYVAARIKKCYRRSAEVIFPPVAVEDFSATEETGDYYLMVGQLVNYKRAEIAVEAFNRLGKRLVVIGEGEQLTQLQNLAASNVEILGWQPFSEIRHHYRHCKALIFPGIEDFGIVPLEAMASGTPVIAFGQGGALDTVIDGVTGKLFHEQTAESLCQAIDAFEQDTNVFKKETLIDWANKFSRENFKSAIKTFIDSSILESTPKRIPKP
ncbi:glycosyltransferase family 4 protein [Teredinibacter waterburyi]|uniref:glycosyltransferase family 4 protein n=1 Tax=Teredinibacter waterburyi TaxID=1500538 RepID=UPI00165FF24F|nr:glycosyltransferase family 4 protein [Teredinibacter waterburyi]